MEGGVALFFYNQTFCYLTSPLSWGGRWVVLQVVGFPLLSLAGRETFFNDLDRHTDIPSLVGYVIEI